MNTFYVLSLNCNAYTLSPQKFVFEALAINFHAFVIFVEWKSNALIPSGDFQKKKKAVGFSKEFKQ